MKAYLDIREINGYSIQYTAFHPATKTDHGAETIDRVPEPIHCLVYIGLPTNPQYLGPQEPHALAEKIVRSRGPSGENREYLYQLEEALNGMGEVMVDEHVTDLARRCREIEKCDHERYFTN